MSNITEISKPCSICQQVRAMTEFAHYKNQKNEIVYGQICKKCASPIDPDEKQRERTAASHQQYQKKLDNYAVQQVLATHQRAFGDVDVPAEPEAPKVGSDDPVFASAGNEYGSGYGQGKEHPILGQAAQFQEAPPNQTPNAADSQQYNELQNELRLRKQLDARLAAQNRSLNRPSGPM